MAKLSEKDYVQKIMQLSPTSLLEMEVPNDNFDVTTWAIIRQWTKETTRIMFKQKINRAYVALVFEKSTNEDGWCIHGRTDQFWGPSEFRRTLAEVYHVMDQHSIRIYDEFGIRNKEYGKQP